MKPSQPIRPRGFTLLETVIAIGVLAVLLTGFMVVFAPAAAGIRKSINVQEADRLASAIEQELVTSRSGDTFKTGFEKAFNWIKTSNTPTSAILVYQYRGELGGTARPDGTPEPVPSVDNKLPGKNYVVVPMARRNNDPTLKKDLTAIEGSVYLVKCTQLVFSPTAGTGLILGKAGAIADPKGTATSGVTDADSYPEAVIAFSADFYTLPSKSVEFFSGNAFSTTFDKAKTPVFSRNLAVRR
jgi:prepilin-type N-terminal cleavage/methylation domain-containing protein